jgi:hypothetical protein
MYCVFNQIGHTYALAHFVGCLGAGDSKKDAFVKTLLVSVILGVWRK